MILNINIYNYIYIYSYLDIERNVKLSYNVIPNDGEEVGIKTDEGKTGIYKTIRFG